MLRIADRCSNATRCSTCGEGSSRHRWVEQTELHRLTQPRRGTTSQQQRAAMSTGAQAAAYTKHLKPSTSNTKPTS